MARRTEGHRRQDDGRDKPPLVHEAAGAASQPRPRVRIELKETDIRKLLGRAIQLCMDKRKANGEMDQKMVTEVRAVRGATFDLGWERRRAFENALFFLAFDGGLRVKADAGDGEIDYGQDAMWALFPRTVSVLKAQMLLIPEMKRFDLRGLGFRNMQDLAEEARKWISQFQRATGAVKTERDLVAALAAGSVAELIGENRSAAKSYDQFDHAVEAIEEAVAERRRNYARRQSGKDITTEAKAAFVEGEAEAELDVTPESLRAEAATLDAEAEEAGAAKNFGLAAMKQNQAKEKRQLAADLEEKLKNIDREIAKDEAHLETATVTTDPQHTARGEVSLEERGVKVTDVPVETPESLEQKAAAFEVEATGLEAKETEASAAKRYVGNDSAQSYHDAAVSKRAQAAKLHEEAQHLRTKQAEEVKRKAAAAQQPPATETAQPKTTKGERRRARKQAEQAPIAPPDGAPAVPVAVATADPNAEAKRSLASLLASGVLDSAAFNAAMAKLG